MSKLMPKYTLWESINTAISLGLRALEEIRTLARQPGPPGKDGLGFDDVEEELRDGGRYLVHRYIRDGQVIKENILKTAMPVYRGVFHDGRVYDQGDNVTWGGSTWVAMKETGAKPGPDPLEWVLSNKRGRDGKEVVSVPRDPSTPVKI